MKRRNGFDRYKVEYSLTPPTRGFCETEPADCCEHCTEWWQDEWVKAAECVERKRAKIKSLKEQLEDATARTEATEEAGEKLITAMEAEHADKVAALKRKINAWRSDAEDHLEEIAELKAKLAAASAVKTSINYF